MIKDLRMHTLAAAVSAALASGAAQAATITVTTLNDGSVPGACTLRDAVQAANTNAAVQACAPGDPGQDTITFAAGLNGTITLTGGQLDILEASVISGPGADQIRIAGAGSRLFNIAAGATTEIHGLTLSGGRTYGDYQPGGAIYSQSLLHLAGVAVQENATEGQYSEGGAIALFNADLSLLHTSVTSNRTEGHSSSGGGIAVYGGGLNLFNSHIFANHTQGNYSPSGGADVRGGDVWISDSTIRSNHTLGNFSRTGGLYAVLGNVHIIRSGIDSNRTEGDFSAGGGLYVVGDAEIVATTFSGNATLGSFGQAGALSVNGNLTLVNSTLSGNTATGGGGGIYLSGYYNQLSLLHTTVTDNTATGGADAIHISSLGFSTITINASNNLLSDASGLTDLCNKLFEPATSTHNLATDTTCGTASLVGNAPVAPSDLDLGPLAANGGPTPTRALGPASVALGAAQTAACTAPPVNAVDQRGEPRPGTGSAACDVGAFEAQAAVPQLTLSPLAVDFGSWCLNDLAPPETVMAMNSGNAILTVSAVDIPSPPPFGQLPGSCGTPPFTLDPGESCTLVYTFWPTTDGMFSESLAVTSDDPASPHVVTLEGVAEHAILQLSASTLDFGPVPVGDTANASLEVINAGTGCAFEVFGPDALAPLPPPFGVLPGTCPPFPFILAPGGSCELEFTFSPSALGPVVHANELIHDATDGSGAYTLEGGGSVVDSIFHDRFEDI